MTPLSRRELIIAAGSVAVGGAVGAAGIAWMNGLIQPPGPAPTPAPFTFSDWLQQRQVPYLVGHRGVGGVLPEHTLPSYHKAVEWGAQCVEVSVVMSSDNVLYCHHDLSLDRTTTAQGLARRQPSTALDTVKVSIPRLGPRWSGTNMPPLPRLSQVLDELGGKVVLCIEPKDDAAYPVMIEMINERTLNDSVIIKLAASSPRIAMAKESGFPVFVYLGNAEVATKKAIAELGKVLDSTRDCLVLPARSGWDLLKADLVQAAVQTGVPVWVFPVHRRYEVKYFQLLGVSGIIAADVGYQAGVTPPLKADAWSSGQLASGDLTRNPYSDAFNLEWTEEGVIAIPTPGRQAFLTLGSFAPLQAPSYRIAFDICFDPLPTDTWQHLSIAFGHADDRYYEHRLGNANGYHALLRADGTLSLYSHVEGDPNGKELTPSIQSTPLKAGLWSRLTLDVSPDLLRWSRDDGATVQATDTRFRGGYFHIGSSSTNGKLKLRGLAIN